MLYLDEVQASFPAMKKVQIDAIEYSNTWWMPDKSKVIISFENFNFDVNCGFMADE